ncbi:hypothetical protein B0919_13730 [Hymenobacter sp. CRA2]|nr:hypothetical protein B0919_13730 [Hymenobacter sp. CRA2]
MKQGPAPAIPAGIQPTRAIIVKDTKKRWINGTVLHYYFFNRPTDGGYLTFTDGHQEWRSWVGAPDQQAIVRWAFQQWKALGIGLEFREVFSREQAEIRIGFMQDDGSWSYVGRDQVLSIRDANQRTMNFGWNLSDAYGHDTALHEIGHTLGFEHEHQSNFAGIVWNEPAVKAYFGKGTANNWDEETIQLNILNKVAPNSVEGSNWDPNSVMEYHFAPGLVTAPQPYDRTGITPAGGLSAQDRQWILRAYPPLRPAAMLLPGQVEEIGTDSGTQRDFLIKPTQTGLYEIATSGPDDADTLLVLFKDQPAAASTPGPLFLAGDDDSGEERKAKLRVELTAGREYILRAKQVYNSSAEPSIIKLTAANS